MLQEFKAFIFRGNLLDLAIAFVLGVAFAAVVRAFTDGIVMALIAAVVGEPSFDDIVLELGDGRILVGTFLTAVVNFVIVAAALFLLMKVAQAAMTFRKEGADAETPAPSDETVLLTEIRDLLRTRP